MSGVDWKVLGRPHLTAKTPASNKPHSVKGGGFEVALRLTSYIAQAYIIQEQKVNHQPLAEEQS